MKDRPRRRLALAFAALGVGALMAAAGSGAYAAGLFAADPAPPIACPAGVPIVLQPGVSGESGTWACTPLPSPSTVTVTSPVPVPTIVPTTVTTTVTVTPSASLRPTVSPSPSPTTIPSPSPSPTGWPDAASTGPDRDCSTLTRRGDVTLSIAGQVLENADVHGTITVTAANVTIRNTCVRPDTARDFGIVIRWVRGTVVDRVLIVGAGRVHQGIQAYDDSGVTVRHTEVSGTDDAISTGVGLIEESYLHSPRSGGHADMVEATGYRSSWSQSGLTVRHNTILNSLSQTSAIALFQDTGEAFRNATITGNLLGGGAYTIYGGAGAAGAGQNIVITGNTFQTCGSAGCVTAFDGSGPGNIWSGNTRANGTPVNP